MPKKSLKRMWSGLRMTIRVWIAAGVSIALLSAVTLTIIDSTLTSAALPEQIRAQLSQQVLSTAVAALLIALLIAAWQARVLDRRRWVMQQVLDALPFRVFWKDARRLAYLGCNREVVLPSGYDSTDDLIGKTDLDMPWAKEGEKYREDDRRILSSNMPRLNIEEPQTLEDGSVVWLLTNKVPLHDASGRIFGVMGTAEDITARKNTENQMRDSETRLRESVAAFTQFIQRVADGELSMRLNIDSSQQDDLYWLGYNLNQMVERLDSMIGQIREAASAVGQAAADIEATTTQQVASSLEQEATVTQTAATVEEIRTTVAQTAERARMVAAASRESVSVSRAGEEAVIDTVGGMALVQQRVNDIAENILSLSARTQQIGEIIDTVNALAEQSKLLALNASIEAARAGEEGRGFAVVAMEVRQLAEQSRAATARVRDILGEIQQATNTAVMVTEEGSKGAESGMNLVERAGESIRELAATLEEAAQAATQIAASTHQQTNGMDQLVAAMSQIRAAATQTAASTRQAEQSVRKLLDVARQLGQVAGGE
jgi:PAS domain S-box-containing protein